jgi:hypothetical protein
VQQQQQQQQQQQYSMETVPASLTHTSDQQDLNERRRTAVFLILMFI